MEASIRNSSPVGATAMTSITASLKFWASSGSKSSSPKVCVRDLEVGEVNSGIGTSL